MTEKPRKCQLPGCDNEAGELQYPDGSPAFFCDEHLLAAGFCAGCHGFYGGIESLYFIDPIGYCDDCKDDPDLFPTWETNEDDDEDEFDPYWEFG